MTFRKVVCLLIFCFCSSLAFSWEDKYEVVKSFNDDFLIFDAPSDAYVPFIPGASHVSKTISFVITSHDMGNRFIKIQCNGGFSIFINGKVFESYASQNEAIIPISDLLRYESPAQHLVTIYTDVNINNISAVLLRETRFRSKATTSVAGISSNNSYKETFYTRNAFLKDAKERYLIGAFMSILLFILIKMLFPNFILSLFTPVKNSDAVIERSSLKLNYYQNESIIMLLISSLFIGIYFYVFTNEINIFKKLTFLNNTNGLWIFLSGFLLAFFLFILKIIVNVGIAAIFGVGNFAKILINEFTRTIFQLLFFLYPLYYIVLSPYNSLKIAYSSHVIYPICLLIIIFVLKELYYFYELFNFRKIYIIAYICICDLFPTCILLKVLTQLEFV